VEVVRALPHLHPGTIRTHVVSRCCVNAPKNHPHKWDYFERVSRGLYRILRPYRHVPESGKRAVAERPATYGSTSTAPARDTIHAVASRSRGWYVAECLEIAVVTQGRTLDELVSTRGSHAKLRRKGPDGQPQILTIPLHRELAPGTVRAIFRRAVRFVPEKDLKPLFFA
jgi:hypothetical protein